MPMPHEHVVRTDIWLSQAGKHDMPPTRVTAVRLTRMRHLAVLYSAPTAPAKLVLNTDLTEVVDNIYYYQSKVTDSSATDIESVVAPSAPWRSSPSCFAIQSNKYFRRFAFNILLSLVLHDWYGTATRHRQPTQRSTAQNLPTKQLADKGLGSRDSPPENGLVTSRNILLDETRKSSVIPPIPDYDLDSTTPSERAVTYSTNQHILIMHCDYLLVLSYSS
ncbi:hypothetical protein C8R43DRAFT_1229454, partial [Mycena crocata]